MLHHHRDNDRWVFRAQGFVNAYRIGKGDFVKFTEQVFDRSTIELNDHFLSVHGHPVTV
jgi:hypothetical protein